MPISYRQAVKTLKEAGFQIERTAGSHQTWKHPAFDTRVVIGFHGTNEPLRRNEVREFNATIEAVRMLADD